MVQYILTSESVLWNLYDKSQKSTSERWIGFVYKNKGISPALGDLGNQGVLRSNKTTPWLPWSARGRLRFIIYKNKCHE